MTSSRLSRFVNGAKLTLSRKTRGLRQAAEHSQDLEAVSEGNQPIVEYVPFCAFCFSLSHKDSIAALHGRNGRSPKRLLQQTQGMSTIVTNISQHHATWVDLFDPEQYFPVLDILSSYLTIAYFLVLCRACKGLAKLQEYMLKKVSNINLWLGDFVDEPGTFRTQLGNYGALISGPFALNVLELGNRGVPYLDVLIQDGVNANRLANYIKEAENYHEESQGEDTVRPH